MGWMKEVWRLMQEEQMSYDKAIDQVIAERKRREAELEEYERVRDNQK